MKSCKKITALVIAMILAFSALACIAGAQSEEATTTEVTTGEDLSYSYPSDFYFPETTTTEKDNSAIEGIVSNYSEELSEISETVKEKTGLMANLTAGFSQLLELFYGLLQKISDIFFPVKPTA